MRVFKQYRMMLTSLVLGMSFLLNAQIQQESLVLLTDRGHYVSGEVIHYRAYYTQPDPGAETTWSSVLYLELILPNGSPLAQGKVNLDANGASGSLLIPQDLASGTYYLKAYTRWMRNCGPEAYVYTSLQVYDPYNEEVLPVDTLGRESAALENMLEQSGSHSPDMLICGLDKDVYGTREEVEVNLRWNFSPAPVNLTLSVTKTGLQGDQHYIHQPCPGQLQKGSRMLPETQGLSLTGQAVSISDTTPAPYATIYVSVLGEDRDFFCNYSDSSGRFYFAFPDYLGDRDLFVSSYHEEVSDLELLIDRDFSQDALRLSSYPLLRNANLGELITEMSVNAQVKQQYYPVGQITPEIPPAQDLMFYGRPTSTVRFDDFIRLPRLSEYFVEVIPQVAVRRSGGERRLVLLGEHPELAIYPPLLMIDGVAIFDVEAVLAVSPRLIDRIEIVNAPYIRGNVTFGGIISLISKNNDLGYIDLPSSGLLVNYRMLDIPLADSLQGNVQDPRLPDFRNTLHWEPSLTLDPETGQKITFRTADLKGSYEIQIRGFDSTGKYLEKRVPFRVD